MDVSSFEVSTANLGAGVFAVEVSGELDLETTPALGHVIEGLGPDDHRGLVIDLTGCDFIDSTGVALLVKTWRRFENGNGSGRKVVLCCPTEQVRKVIEITGLADSMTVCSDRESAEALLLGQ